MVDFEEEPLPDCPKEIEVEEGCDPTRVKAYGPGLEKGTTNQTAKFTVDTRGAGSGGLGLSIEGPSDAQITCTVSLIIINVLLLKKTCN